MKTVLLYAAYTDQLSYYDDWTDAFTQHAKFITTAINVCMLDNMQSIAREVQEADVIVLHHSMTGDTLKYLEPLVSLLLNRRGKLVAFVGNEVNLPILGMAPKIALLQKLNVDIIATQLLLEAGAWLYAECNAKIISLPHALNTQKFRKQTDHIQRNIHLGTRSARYGAYIGDNDRNAIIEYFHNNADKYKLNVDLGLNPGSKERFNREEWGMFLNSCRATLSTEAGSFYLQKDDAIVQAMQQYYSSQRKGFIIPKQGVVLNLYRKLLNKNIKQFIRKALGDYLIEEHKLLDSIDVHKIQAQFFQSEKKCPVYSKAISSRHFDAIGTHTLHVMYPGRYNDILKPGIHYFELQRDHSNVNELLELLNDFDKIRQITKNTYEYVLEQHTHKHRLDYLATIL